MAIRHAAALCLGTRVDGVTAGKRVLVIDDSQIVVDAVREVLADAGVEVEASDELDRGLDGFDLILIDVQLPTSFGERIAGILRLRTAAVAAPPVLLLSSLPEPELAARTAAAGLDGYILKQAGIEAIADQIYGWLAKER